MANHSSSAPLGLPCRRGRTCASSYSADLPISFDLSILISLFLPPGGIFYFGCFSVRSKIFWENFCFSLFPGAVGLPRSLRAPAFYFLYFPSHILPVCSFFHLIVPIFNPDQFFPLGCSTSIPSSIFLSAFGFISWFHLEPSDILLSGLWGFSFHLQFFSGLVRFFVPYPQRGLGPFIMHPYLLFFWHAPSFELL